MDHDITLRELLQCVRELTAVMLRAKPVKATRADYAVMPPKKPEISPYAVSSTLSESGGFRAVLKRAVVRADKLKDALLSSDLKVGMGVAFLCSLLRLARDDSALIGTGSVSVSKGCLILFDNVSFGSRVGEMVVEDDGLKRIFRVFALRINDNLSNVGVLSAADEIDSIVRGMLSILGRELQASGNGYPYGISNPTARLLLDELIGGLIQPRKEFRDEYTCDFQSDLYLGGVYDDEYDDETFETESEVGSDRFERGESEFTLKDDTQPVFKPIESEEPEAHESSFAEISYRNGVLDTYEGLDAREKSFKIALFDANAWLMSCMKAYEGTSPGFSVVNKMVLSIFCNILLEFASGSFAIELNESKAKYKFKSLLRKVHFAGGCADLMMQRRPFDKASPLRTLFVAISRCVAGFDARLDNANKPSALNETMVSVLSNIGTTLHGTRSVFLNTFGVKCAATLDLALKSYSG
jgi:hypothetical protein